MVAWKSESENRVAGMIEKAQEQEKFLSSNDIKELEEEYLKCDELIYSYMKKLFTLLEDHMFTEEEFNLIHEIMGESVNDFRQKTMPERLTIVILGRKIAPTQILYALFRVK